MKGHRKLEKVQEKDMNFFTVPWYLQTEHFFQVTLRTQIVTFPKIKEVRIKHKTSFTAICVCECVCVSLFPSGEIILITKLRKSSPSRAVFQSSYQNC